MRNSNVGERMDYENPRALPTRVPESNYGSSGSIAAKNHERKRPAEKKKSRRDQFVGIIECEDDASQMNPVAEHVYRI